MLEPHVKRNGPRKVGGDGEVEVFCADEQTEVAVDVARWHQLAKNILISEGVRGAAELTLMFVPESAIAGLNEKYMARSDQLMSFRFHLMQLNQSTPQGPGHSRAVPTKQLSTSMIFLFYSEMSSSAQKSRSVRHPPTQAILKTSLLCS